MAYVTRTNGNKGTSPQISQLISTYTKRTLQAAQQVAPQTLDQGQALKNPVDLVCELEPYDNSYAYGQPKQGYHLQLKVAQGKTSYVVQNIEELLDARKTGKLVSYGRLLAFSHQRGNFTARANNLMDLLEGVVEERERVQVLLEEHSSRSYGYYGQTYSFQRFGRSMALTIEETVCLLNIMQGASVCLIQYRSEKNYCSSRRKRTMLTVTSDMPKLHVHMVNRGRGSFEISMEPNDVRCLGNENGMYLYGNKTIAKCPEAFARDLGPLCQALLPQKEPLAIRKADMPSFCSAVVPLLRKHGLLNAPKGLDAFLPPEPEFSFRIAVNHGYVTCEATVRYGDRSLLLLEPVRESQCARNAEREIGVQQLVRAYFPFGNVATPDYAHSLPGNSPTASNDSSPEYGRVSVPAQPAHPWFLHEDDDRYYALLAKGLNDLSQVGEVLLSDKLRHAKVRSSPSIQMDASVRSGLLDLMVASSDMTPAELAAYLASYQRHQRFVRLSDGDILRVDESAATMASLAEGLGIEAKDLAKGVRDIPANRTLFVDAMAKRAGVHLERNDAFRKIVRDFETIADADFALPEGLNATLRPYQEEGFKWLCTLGQAGFGGILADDMGLGKTLQLLSFLLRRSEQRTEGERRPSLVVCPASLVYNWQAEAERFAPSLEVACVVGPKDVRLNIIDDAQEYDLLITSYDLMRRDVEDLAAQEFWCVALDEAQYVKNHNTKAAKAARQLNASVRFALTGTPIENRLSELWSIFDFLMPGVLGSAKSFAQRFSQPIGAGEEGAAERLQALVAPFILRRNKQDVLRDLPGKNESVVVASMSGEQDKLYRARASKLVLSLQKQRPEEFAGSRIQVLAELTKLRQVCCDPHLLYQNYRGGSAKLDACMELVRQAVEGDHKVLLFSQFTSMLDVIGERLTKEGVEWLMLTGSTSKEQRRALVQKFQAGEAPVFLISLKAGGTGLNLTAADVVIHFDPWWNLAAQSQATDRAHRIGQKREVSVFKLIAKDTIEERIVAMQEAKNDLAESVLGGEATARTAISKDDILALLNAA